MYGCMCTHARTHIYTHIQIAPFPKHNYYSINSGPLNSKRDGTIFFPKLFPSVSVDRIQNLHLVHIPMVLTGLKMFTVSRIRKNHKQIIASVIIYKVYVCTHIYITQKIYYKANEIINVSTRLYSHRRERSWLSPGSYKRQPEGGNP